MKQDRKSGEATDVAITVVRTGGFAGIPRRWGVIATEAEARPWIELIDRCPWQATASPAFTGVDRFSWTVQVSRGPEQRRAALSESDVDGPWRALIEAVREASAASGDRRSVASTEE